MVSHHDRWHKDRRPKRISRRIFIVVFYLVVAVSAYILAAVLFG